MLLNLNFKRPNTAIVGLQRDVNIDFSDVTFNDCNDIILKLVAHGYEEISPMVVPNRTLEYKAYPILPFTKANPKVEKVIFNDPATIIIWKDGTKTVVKCQEGDTYSKETGFVMCYLKKLLGNDNTFNKEIVKWVNE